MSRSMLKVSLVGVLHRFSKETITVMADIQQMFNELFVTVSYSNFLRFLWHKDHDPQKELVGYMTWVSVFRNYPSPTIAT